LNMEVHQPRENKPINKNNNIRDEKPHDKMAYFIHPDQWSYIRLQYVHTNDTHNLMDERTIIKYE
jgi:hypothetical protein